MIKIVYAGDRDIPLIHLLMQRAFAEYDMTDAPSSAMDETMDSIQAAREDGEQGLIAYMDNEPVGMVRFQVHEDAIYFYRLAVIPEQRGCGVATSILKELENIARIDHKMSITCRVRALVTRNVHLYQSLGYKIIGECRVHKASGQEVPVAIMRKHI
ncbi:GNAT family N-acetyltransferase [Sporolactobacillus sp. Y61]|uniref:GNAT family N-acetyltransferase n=1 Tax=Sporolactobacillus sp. Y61 TaxID=3160863 RepID=A0AAU8IEN8_9BACL